MSARGGEVRKQATMKREAEVRMTMKKDKRTDAALNVDGLKIFSDFNRCVHRPNGIVLVCHERETRRKE